MTTPAAAAADGKAERCSKDTARPVSGRRVCGNSASLAPFWLVNLLVTAAAPVLFVKSAVVPLLEEAVPFITSALSLPDYVSLLLQVLCVAWLLLTCKAFYAAQTARPPREKRFNKCAEEVAVDAAHCELCGECVEARLGHSVLLNRCVGAWNVPLYLSLLRRLAAGSVALLLVVYVEEALGRQPWRPQETVILTLCAYFSVLLHWVTSRKASQEQRDKEQMSPGRSHPHEE